MAMQVERLTLEAHSVDNVITTVDTMRPPPSPVWKPSPVTISIPPNTGPTKVWPLAMTMAHNTAIMDALQRTMSARHNHVLTGKHVSLMCLYLQI